MHRVKKFSPWRKYKNKPVERNGVHYDSKLESKVGFELEMQERAGKIKEIRRQVDFPMMVNGFKITTYRADFVVVNDDDSKEVVEAKGFLTDTAAIKLKLFEALYTPEYKLTVVKR